MISTITIHPMGPMRATVRPPGSKSITNRALICAALADGRSTLTGVLDSEDTRVMFQAIRDLGIALEWDRIRAEIVVDGSAGKWPVREGNLFVANSGTSMRFLAAMLPIGDGRYRLDGVPRMRERPIGDLLRALRQLGARIDSEAGNDCPPVVVRASGLPGGVADIRGDISSQFLSGLLMAAPYARHPVRLDVIGPLVSQPYVRMTLRVMESFGLHLPDCDLTRFEIPRRRTYRGRPYAIEPDASAASYFWAAAAITGGTVTRHGTRTAGPAGRRRFLRLPGTNGL